MAFFPLPVGVRDCFHLSLHPDKILAAQQQGQGSQDRQAVAAAAATDDIDMDDYRYQLLQEQGLVTGYDLGGIRRGRPLMWSLRSGETPTEVNRKRLSLIDCCCLD